MIIRSELGEANYLYHPYVGLILKLSRGAKTIRYSAPREVIMFL